MDKRKRLMNVQEALELLNRLSEAESDGGEVSGLSDVSWLSCSLSSFFSCSPLSAAVTDFFLTRLKYEYFKAKKLKGNNEMAPKLNYTPFPESQKRDFSE
ncbi:hypothetical protein JOQ06_007675 [Pogonophryne albipinna]|uniref:Uncharacterized protein n=1 Tax=Pogonophryne albipinna TaxID=1090488 RepID=A0AAD6B267_9TELE|nr:hypothetical protein JOQ06_007675 [Pogonophryne albipinna]